ncbi:hypothetical protein WMY93_031086 [Mugilogobius chulae]|uniref:Uncharacterized protein n=1 Tax=Mugilogobius chulae TaxID=88201 RepID=A0AAW0MMH4_9GOBI
MNGKEMLQEEAYRAFMRLQLVRKKLISLNNAMVAMRDRENLLTPMFDWVDIRSDTLNSDKVDRKKVREMQGALFTPANSGARQTASTPETIVNLNLSDLDMSLGKFIDCKKSKEEGRLLFNSLIKNLSGAHWRKHKAVRSRYDMSVEDDEEFIRKVINFTDDLHSSHEPQIQTGGLLVFKYSLDKLIHTEAPDMFVKTLIHRHVPVAQCRIDNVLRDIRKKRRTRGLRILFRNSSCGCCRNMPEADSSRCRGTCQTAYVCFYNFSDKHPFYASRDEQSYYFAQLYPHLGKLERLSKEMKLRYKEHRQFESIANMVFDILIRRQFSRGSLYEGLSESVEEKPSNSSLSLGGSLSQIHLSLCMNGFSREHDQELLEDVKNLHPLKVYDHALVRYMFCDTLKVGRLFQASTTFNYIVSNTAPRYTIERIMLFNVTGPGEGKSYANKVLNYQFRLVSGCIETLTSFTPQAFKYNQKRSSCVVMIDDAHITHEKNTKFKDRESNVIPNTFKNILDTSTLESEVVTTEVSSGKAVTVKYKAIHNCGFVWNANTLGFVSEAWADRCLIMESEFQKNVYRTLSTKQIQDIVETEKMDRIAAVCLYRQNLVQSATMIADSSLMQFSANFDKARDACIYALHRSHIVCGSSLSRRVSACVNQLVFAEALKLSCHFVFDIWVPPWTRVPSERHYSNLRHFLKKLNKNRLKALNKLSFGQICLEINAVYKLCTSACLPDICPRVVDSQGYFACKLLAHVLTQIHEQNLRTTLKNGSLCVGDIETMYFSETEIKGGTSAAHEMLSLCSMCKVPSRGFSDTSRKTYSLCSYRYAGLQNLPSGSRTSHLRSSKRVGSVTVPLDVVYDLLAIFAPTSHRGFWEQLSEAMLEAYESRDESDRDESEYQDYMQLSSNCTRNQIDRVITFDLDFRHDPNRSLLLEATAGIEPLSELSFSRKPLDCNTFRCSAPIYFGGVIQKILGDRAPVEAHNEAHQKEATQGPGGTFHGPRLRVYCSQYSGVPVMNLSSFCPTRTVYHQDKIFLRTDPNDRPHLAEVEDDWEWKDAVAVFDTVHGTNVFSVEMLKRDYSSTMLITSVEARTRLNSKSRARQPSYPSAWAL